MVFPLSSLQEDLSSPLHVACTNSHYDMVKLLLSNGACLHTEDADGMTPMLRLFSSVIKPHPFNVSQLYKNNKINWSNNSI